MSSDVAIHVQDAGKAYHLYARPVDRLKQIVAGRHRRYYREFWALRGVDLTVRRGETVGIIGRNGSGKSTLLQMICGTLKPTTGHVSTHGRVAALLELGAGFNPDYTGRENVQLYGAVLGMTREQIGSRMQQILEFAEIGDFIDAPVKTYSSGMFVRLAFSVAIHVDPEILVVDEALAVGDGRFQHRCMQRIRRLQEAGVSILYVSHDTEGVKRLCSRVVVLQDGRIVNQGDPADMSNWYIALMTANYDLVRLREIEADAYAFAGRHAVNASDVVAATAPLPVPTGETPEFKYFRHGDGNARILSVQIADSQGRPTEVVHLGDTIEVRIDVEFNVDVDEYVIGMMMRDRLGTDVVALNSFQEKTPLPPAGRGERFRYIFRVRMDARPGCYGMAATVAYDQYRQEWLDWVDNAAVFRVIDRDVSRMVFGVYLPPERNIEWHRVETLITSA